MSFKTESSQSADMIVYTALTHELRSNECKSVLPDGLKGSTKFLSIPRSRTPFACEKRLLQSISAAKRLICLVPDVATLTHQRRGFVWPVLHQSCAFPSWQVIAIIILGVVHVQRDQVFCYSFQLFHSMINNVNGLKARNLTVANRSRDSRNGKTEDRYDQYIKLCTVPTDKYFYGALDKRAASGMLHSHVLETWTRSHSRPFEMKSLSRVNMTSY